MSENHEANPVETGAASAGKTTLAFGRGGIVGVKAGMTQFFDANSGAAYGVTVLSVPSNVVTAVKTKEKHGYVGVQIGASEKREKSVSKPEKGQFKNLGKNGFYFLNEFRFEDDVKLDSIKTGQELTAEFLKPGDLVDLVAISKGKGFQGVVKRYHFGGMNASHGTSVTHRSAGSIGNRADPAKVFKGKKMSGQMGNIRVTVQNVKVIDVDLENGIVLVHGSVPGPKSGFVIVRKAVKSGGK